MEKEKRVECREFILELPRRDSYFDGRVDAERVFDTNELCALYPDIKIAEFSHTMYFSEFVNFVCDVASRDGVKYSNDINGIPPIQSFIRQKPDLFDKKVPHQDKLALFACFDYLYCHVYGGYKAKLAWVGDHEITKILSAFVFVKEGRLWN